MNEGGAPNFNECKDLTLKVAIPPIRNAVREKILSNATHSNTSQTFSVINIYKMFKEIRYQIKMVY